MLSMSYDHNDHHTHHILVSYSLAYPTLDVMVDAVSESSNIEIIIFFITFFGNGSPLATHIEIMVKVS